MSSMKQYKRVPVEKPGSAAVLTSLMPMISAGDAAKVLENTKVFVISVHTLLALTVNSVRVVKPEGKLMVGEKTNIGLEATEITIGILAEFRPLEAAAP